MTTYESVSNNSTQLISSARILGTAGAGFILLTSQTIAPTTVASNITTYSDSSNRLSFGSSIIATIDTSLLTTDRIWTTPSGSDALVGVNTAATLANKTIVDGASGNIVVANSIGNVVITGTPSVGQNIKATGTTAAKWDIPTKIYYNICGYGSLSTTSASWTGIQTAFLFMGTAIQTLISISVNTTTTASGSVRITDTTYSTVICSSAVAVGANITTTITGPINQPTLPAMWQLQAEVTSGTITVNSYTMQFT